MNPFHPRFRFLWFLLFWVLLGAGVSYYFRPSIPHPKNATNATYKAVELPAYPDMQRLDAEYAYLKDNYIFYPKKNKTVKKPPPPPPPKKKPPKDNDNDKKKQEKKKPKIKWFLRGVVAVDKDTFAIIEVHNRTKWYGEGDELPNGEVLKDIFQDKITYVEQKKEHEVPLYNTEKEPKKPDKPKK